MTARRVAGATVIGLITVTQCCAPPAHALTPPPIDNSRLPAAALPVAPQATEQREMCAVPRRSRATSPAANPLHSLDLTSVWRLTRGEGQRVAVIDTGVNRHPRLAHLEAGGDYVATGDGTQDCDGHGTIVAGIIAAVPDPADQVGFAGLAPAATVISIRQSSTKFGPGDDPSITGFGDVDTMAMAVRTAADLGATVINISSVACAAGTLDDRALGAALAYAVDVKDVVVVVAAGNVGGASQCPKQPEDPELSWDTATVAVSPAWYDDYVLTVGAIGPDGSPSSLDRLNTAASSPSTTDAEQWCRASWRSFRRSSTSALACTSVSVRRITAMNFDRLTSNSACTSRPGSIVRKSTDAILPAPGSRTRADVGPAWFRI